MNEHDFVRNIAESFPRSTLQRNGLFECDAEILDIGGQLWGLTLDDFSPEEDLFGSDDPVRLGKNLAVATLSDLFAAGAEPAFFMQSVSLPRRVAPRFVEGLMKGLRSTLGALGCFLCGGDVGVAEPWRFCGFAMGPIRSSRPLTHRLPPEAQTLWVTGALGDANLAALRRTETPQFELRNREAAAIRSCATGCMDTSGGLLDALWLLHERNPELRFDVRLKDVPVAEGVGAAADAMGFPMDAALLGGAGEYELLFALPEALPAGSRDRLSSVAAACIGTTGRGPEPGIHLHRRDGSRTIMTEPPPCPRAAETVKDHAREVLAMARRLFGTGEQP